MNGSCFSAHLQILEVSKNTGTITFPCCQVKLHMIPSKNNSCLGSNQIMFQTRSLSNCRTMCEILALSPISLLQIGPANPVKQNMPFEIVQHLLHRSLAHESLYHKNWMLVPCSRSFWSTSRQSWLKLLKLLSQNLPIIHQASQGLMRNKIIQDIVTFSSSISPACSIASWVGFVCPDTSARDPMIDLQQHMRGSCPSQKAHLGVTKLT